MKKRVDLEFDIEIGGSHIMNQLFNFTISSFHQISINVTDVNDCQPAFQGIPYKVHIYENTPNGTQIELNIRFFQ